MSVSPQYVGKYGKPWSITLATDTGNDDITNVNPSLISVVVRNLNTATEAVSAGTITVTSNTPAQITWQPTSTDYAAPGSFQAIPMVTFPTGPVEYDPIPFVILTT